MSNFVMNKKRVLPSGLYFLNFHLLSAIPANRSASRCSGNPSYPTNHPTSCFCACAVYAHNTKLGGKPSYLCEYELQVYFEG